jgi:phosphocarrier protein HPr
MRGAEPDPVTSRTAAIVNPLGLHARAAARFVRVAAGFRSHIRVTRGQRTTDGKSILGLLLLAAARGAAVTITADGPDESQALDALCALTAQGFEDA